MLINTMVRFDAEIAGGGSLGTRCIRWKKKAGGCRGQMFTTINAKNVILSGMLKDMMSMIFFSSLLYRRGIQNPKRSAGFFVDIGGILGNR